jgi:hypothetical protein
MVGPQTSRTQAYSIDNGLTWTLSKNQLSTLSGFYWKSVSYGNGVFVIVGEDTQAYSTDNGLTWKYADVQIPGFWWSVTYGNGIFVMVCGGNQAYSTDNGLTWNAVASPLHENWDGVAFGNGVFVMIYRSDTANGGQAYSTDNGLTWNYAVTQQNGGGWTGISFGNGVFVAVGVNDTQIYSLDDGLTWNYATSQISGYWENVTFGNGVFVMTAAFSTQAYSNDNGLTWNYATTQIIGAEGLTYGSNTFVTVDNDKQTRSTDDGVTWNYAETQLSGGWSNAGFGEFAYTNSPSDSVSLIVPPLQVTDRVFSSDIYPSISFANAADAAFWGFDSREGLTYSLTATPPWTLTQSGWISGFLPPSTSTYDDSVAHKLCKAVRVLVGKQTIKEYSGEYIELQNDLLVPYENKAILKLMNGTLDQTQATVAREYYVNLPLGTKEVPLCALTHQHMSVEVDFDSYLNVSQNLNQGTGDFLDAKSYLTYDASTGLLNGQPVNVQTTFSYQQYIFIVTYGGQFIIFDTTKNVDDPDSYIVLSAFSGSSLFSQFCVLSGNLYIGLTDGQLARMIISELIQGNISSFVVNNYTPTIGSLTGTIVADFRYVYYTVSNTVTSNVFLSRYDTTGVFTSPSSYTTVDFTKTFNSNVTGVYQTLSTGTELIMLPQGTPTLLYTYQLNANVQSQWYTLDYSSYGYQITEGVLIGNSVYFVSDKFNIVKYTDSIFSIPGLTTSSFVSTGQQILHSNDNGQSWLPVVSQPQGYWNTIAYLNGIFVTTVNTSIISYSTDYGLTWNLGSSPINSIICAGSNIFVTTSAFEQAYSYDGINWNLVSSSISGDWTNIAFGNGVFVMSGYNNQAYSTDNGLSWNYSDVQLPGVWTAAAYGNGVFILVSAYFNQQAYSTDYGLTWEYADSSLSGNWYGAAYGNGVFVMVGDDPLAYSSDNGLSWSFSPSPVMEPFDGVTFANGIFVAAGDTRALSTDGLTWEYPEYQFSELGRNVAASPPKFTIPGDRLRNLVAVGNYIYASTNNVAVQIDTTQDLSTAAAYSFPAPLPINQYVLANGPRYIYMFAQGDNTAKNIVRFDPYRPDTTFKASILVDYESLPPGVPKPDKALLGLVQTQRVTDMNYMNIKGPVKELWVTGQSATTNVFQYSNLAARSTLELTGEQIITNDVGTRTFLNTIEPFETHTSMPIRNFSMVSFEFDPESDIPNGTINFSRIRDQIFEGGAQTVWARNYNLLAIQGGIGGLIFNS